MNTDRSRALPSFVAAGLMAASLAVAPLGGPAVATAVPTDKAACTIVGTAGPDVLRGGPRDDVICGRGGDDLLIGGAGDDELRGGPGDDELRGGSGSDLLRGGRGNDRLIGDGGGDRLRGHAGADRLDGGPGDDRLSGGRGADVLQGGPGTDVLDGGPGPDQVDAQDPPTAVGLSGGEVSENQPAGTEIGRLTAVDADADDTHTFALVPGAGDAGNGAFTIVGDRLLTSRPLDFETTPRLSLRVQATDPAGLRFAASVEVAVRDVAENGGPVAADDTATLDEDAPATDVDVLANDTDPDRDRLTITGIADVTGGTATVSAGRVRFTPAADRCGAGAGGFRYTVSDGRDGTASARVRIDVRCLPDPTVAHDDDLTVDEDAAATAVDVLANDTDPDDETLSVASVTAAAHGTVVLDAGVVTFEPDADYCGPDAFTYTVAGATATVEVTVACVDDAPVAVDDTLDVTEDDAATTVPVRANDTDIDAGPKTVASTTEAEHGEVLLAGGVVTYAPDADYCGTDAFDYTLDGGSDATVTIEVACVDDAPVAVDDVVTVAEDSTVVLHLLANDTDVDGGDLEFTGPRNVPEHGMLSATSTTLDYTPHPDYCGSDSFVYEVNGGSTATVHITVTCVDDAPIAHDDAVTTLVGQRVNVDLLANDSDIDGGPMTAELVTGPSYGTLALRDDGTGGYTPTRDSCGSDPVSHTDSFTYRLLPGGSTATVGITVTCVDDPPIAVADTATVDEDSGATELDLLSNDTDVDGGPKDVSGVTDADHGEVVLADGVVTYEPEADFCGTDTFAYDLSPGDTSATVTVTVDCVDDAPVAVDDTATVLEDAIDASIDVLANETDIDAGPRRIGPNLASQPEHGIVEIAQNGSGLTYTPDADYCGDDGFTYALDGGSTAAVDVTVTCVNDAPVVPTTALNGADAAIGNTTLVVDTDDASYGTVTEPAKVVTAELLVGATDVDGPGELTITPGTITTTRGGTVDLHADGSFRYQPAGAAACNATDSFSYTVSDSGTPVASTTATVQIAVTSCVWYVDNRASVGGDGTSSRPFDTLAEAWGPSRTGDTVFVYAGDGTSTGYDAGVVLRNDQRLLGEVSGLRFGSTVLVAPAPGKRPLLTATNVSVVSLANDNVVSGLRIDPAGGSGVSGGSAVTNGTLSDLQIIDTGAPVTGAALSLIGTKGTVNVSELQIDTAAATNPPSSAVGVRIQSSDTVTFEPLSTVRITTKGAKALSVSDTALGTSQLDQVTVTGSSSGAVDLARATGSVTFEALDLTTNGGTAAAFSVVSSGTVTVAASGTANVRAANSPAVDVTGTPGAVLAFDDVDSFGSTSDGVNLSGLGTGSFTAASGSVIADATGIAFDLDGGSGSVSWAGQITDGPGASAEITNRTGGAVTFSGAVADGVDSGGGISLSGNTGGSTTFSGALTLRTASSPGIVMTGSAGHSLALTGGNLLIRNDSGAGLRATGSGSVNVTGSNNEIETTSGIALEVTDTKIASAGLTFKRISSDRAPVGILLDRTGTTASDGALTITGTDNGVTCGTGNIVGCTGGTIANGSGADNAGATPTGSGIVLNQTRAPSLARMRILGHSNYGIRGTAVLGFSLTDSIVYGAAGNAVAPYHDSAISFTDLTGSASFTRVYVDGGASDDLRIVNGSGSLDRLTVDTVTFGVAGSNPTNDAMLVASSGSAAVKVTVRNSTFNSAAGDLLQIAHDGAGAADVVLTGNTFQNTHPSITDGGGGVSLSQGGSSGAMSMSVTGNTFTGAVGHAVSIVKGRGASTQTGTFSTNQIGTTGIASSGSVAGDGVRIRSLGQGASTWLVTGNTIRQYGGHGISVLAGGSGVASDGAVNATVSGNTVAEFAGSTGYGIQLLLGTTAGDSFLGCAAITGNTVSAGGGIYDISLKQQFATTLRLPGYAGAAADASAVSTYVNAGNGNGNQVHATVTGPPTGGGVTGGPTPCAQPAA